MTGTAKTWIPGQARDDRKGDPEINSGGQKPQEQQEPNPPCSFHSPSPFTKGAPKKSPCLYGHPPLQGEAILDLLIISLSPFFSCLFTKKVYSVSNISICNAYKIKNSIHTKSA
ncbi:hypothetical protein CSB09_04530 [Candidatus Gracilibacteria bacterium]|nr:MAG: hypothetical protein CSB09_04530 [Candidatus Gracilibacteria bacterium]